jgi:DNA-binding transcriptional regulator GbsR (MarR family)
MAEHTTGDAATEFVERMGLFWESEGMPRIAGRLFGYLVLEATPCSLDDMASALAVSKASVSTDIRKLEQVGLVERRTRPGDRRDYYVIAPDMPARIVGLRRATIERFRGCLLSDSTDEALDPVVRDRLRSLEVVHRHIAAALDAIAREFQEAGLAGVSDSDSNQTIPS